MNGVPFEDTPAHYIMILYTAVAQTREDLSDIDLF